MHRGEATHIYETKSGPLPVAEYSALLMHSTWGKCHSLAELKTYFDEIGFTGMTFTPIVSAKSLVHEVAKPLASPADGVLAGRSDDATRPADNQMTIARNITTESGVEVAKTGLPVGLRATAWFLTSVAAAVILFAAVLSHVPVKLTRFLLAAIRRIRASCKTGKEQRAQGATQFGGTRS